ncbi:hypothetical protein Nmel_012085 [Mimus melanotis]
MSDREGPSLQNNSPVPGKGKEGEEEAKLRQEGIRPWTCWKLEYTSCITKCKILHAQSPSMMSETVHSKM